MPIIAAALMIIGVALIFIGLSMPKPEPATVQSRLTSYSNRPLTLAEIEMSKPFSERILKPLSTKLAAVIAARTPQKTLDNIRQKIDEAGNPNNLTVADILGIKGFAALIAGGLAFLIMSGNENFLFKILAPVVGIFVGMMLPDYWLSSKASARQKEIIKSMPDALDLLTISVEAGMGFEQAMQKVSDKWDNALTREFGRALREQRIGLSRREAMRALGQRCGVSDVTTFTSAIIQADQLGTSISRVLQIQSEQMRIRRRQKAEKLAHEAPLKMTFPMVMFMMPALWIVILGPMWPNMAIMMGGGK